MVMSTRLLEISEIHDRRPLFDAIKSVVFYSDGSEIGSHDCANAHAVSLGVQMHMQRTAGA
jgi:hypothetical protein